MASATIPARSNPVSLPSDTHAWDTDRLTDEAVRAIQSCRKHGKAAAKNAWQAGSYLSILHARLVKGRRWAAWLRNHEEVVSEDTARRYRMLYERTEGRVADLDGMTLTEAYAAFNITRFMEVAPVETGSNGNGSIHGIGGSGADHRRQPSHSPPMKGSNGHHGPSPSDLDEKAILRAAKEIRQRQVIERSHRQRNREEAARSKRGGKRAWTITAGQAAVRCDLLLADPPMALTDEPWEPTDLEGYTRDWCGRWSGCGADFVAIFWCQRWLWEGRRWFDESLAGYEHQQLLVWHSNNHGGPKSRHVLKQTWYPIFLYRRLGSNRRIITEDKVWSAECHQLDCHVAPAPQAGYGGHDLRQHPCQKPVSVMRWLINALTEPGEKVASPFCGVAPCGIAAVQLGRTYHGVEINAQYRKVAEGRIAMYGQVS